MKILKGKFRDKKFTLNQFCNDWFTVEENNEVFSITNAKFTKEEFELITSSNTGLMMKMFIDSNYYKGINTGSQGGRSSLEKGKRQIIIKDKAGNGTWTVRRLTPVECERLQGFPDNYTSFGIDNNVPTKISDTQRYKCLGNAVTTNVITYLASNLPIDSN